LPTRTPNRNKGAYIPGGQPNISYKNQSEIMKQIFGNNEKKYQDVKGLVQSNNKRQPYDRSFYNQKGGSQSRSTQDYIKQRQMQVMS
jgi:hypothetical protein